MKYRNILPPFDINCYYISLKYVWPFLLYMSIYCTFYVYHDSIKFDHADVIVSLSVSIKQHYFYNKFFYIFNRNVFVFIVTFVDKTE